GRGFTAAGFVGPALDRQTQGLAEPKRRLRNARLGIEHAAEGRRAWAVIENTAEGMRRHRHARHEQRRRDRSISERRDHFASAATCTRVILSGLCTGSPFLSLSTTSMPETTSPTTVYWPLRNEPSAYMM